MVALYCSACWSTTKQRLERLYRTFREAGVMTSDNDLQPPHTGSTVRVRNVVRQVLDSPRPDTEEQLGGYVIIELPNLDAASNGRPASHRRRTPRPRCVPFCRR